MNLMELLDNEAPIIAEEEETNVEVQSVSEEEASENFDVDLLSDEDSANEDGEDDEE